MVVPYDDDLHDLAPFFQKPTCWEAIFFANTSKALLTLSTLLDTGGRLKIVTKDFLPLVWEGAIQRIKLPQLQMASHEVIHVEINLLLIVRIGNLCIGLWFAVV